MSKLPLPNRLAAYGTAAIALIAGLAPLVGNLDWESTAGILAGLAAILTVAVKWLTGWQEYAKAELYDRGEDTAAEWDVDPEPPIDGFNEDDADPIPDEVVDAAHRDPEQAASVPTPAKGKRSGTTHQARPPGS